MVIRPLRDGLALKRTILPALTFRLAGAWIEPAGYLADDSRQAAMTQAIFHHAKHRFAGVGKDDAVWAKPAGCRAGGKGWASVDDPQHRSGPA